MLNCPYNNSCIKFTCDLACKEFSEFTHWMNRCELSLDSSAIQFQKHELDMIENLILKTELLEIENSNYTNLSVFQSPKPQYISDLLTYVLICNHCKDLGLYQGVYRLNFYQYLEEIKKSWNTRYNAEHLEDMNIWIKTSKYLVVNNLSLVRFGDFEAQTLLTIFQDRCKNGNLTFVILESGKYPVPGKSDSLFYTKLKHELVARGAKL